jgi:arylsulfatase
MWPFHPEYVNLPPDLAERKKGFPPLPMFDGDQIVNASVTHADQDQLTTQYTERAVKFIERNKTRPFFLYLAHNMPHVPLHVSDKFRGATERGLYGDVMAEIDWSAGQVLAALQRHSLTDRTWVIFTSDNGPWLSYGSHAGSAYPLREGKGTCWEGGTRVPCIMRWPGKIPAGTESKEMLMTVDLFPTIAKRIGAALPEHQIDGLDVWTLISGQPGAANPHGAYWFYYENNQLQSVMTGDGRWKLQLPHSYRTLSGRKGGNDGTPIPYDQARIEHEELYDLAADIGEERNVATLNPGILKRLLAHAEEARRELGDSLSKRAGAGVRQPGRIESASTD